MTVPQECPCFSFWRRKSCKIVDKNNFFPEVVELRGFCQGVPMKQAAGHISVNCVDIPLGNGSILVGL